jgi:hypothetical protein
VVSSIYSGNETTLLRGTLPSHISCLHIRSGRNLSMFRYIYELILDKITLRVIFGALRHAKVIENLE